MNMAHLFPLEDYPEHMRPHIEAARRSVSKRRLFVRSINVVFYTMVAALLMIAAWLLEQAADRAIPTETKVTITTPLAHPGADLTMSVKPLILKRCEGKVRFRALDRLGNVISDSETAWRFPIARIGPDKEFKREVRLRQDAVLSEIGEDGKPIADATLRIERSFYCNWVQKKLRWPIVELSGDMPFALVASKP